jgi:hypothetical protein
MLPVLAATSLLALSALAQEAGPAPAAASSPAVVEITSTRPAVMVARIEGHSTGVGTTTGTTWGYGAGGVIGGGTAVIHTTAYRDLCVTPCRVELPPGAHELSFYGQGYLASNERYSLQPGETRVLSVEPGSFGLAYASLLGVTLGIVSTITGGVFLALDAAGTSDDKLLGIGTDAALVGSGLVFAGLGTWGMKSTRTVVNDVTPPALARAPGF